MTAYIKVLVELEVRCSDAIMRVRRQIEVPADFPSSRVVCISHKALGGPVVVSTIMWDCDADTYILLLAGGTGDASRNCEEWLEENQGWQKYRNLEEDPNETPRS